MENISLPNSWSKYPYEPKSVFIIYMSLILIFLIEIVISLWIRYHISNRAAIDTVSCIGKSNYVSYFILKNIFFFVSFQHIECYKITTPFSCDRSSMFVWFTIDIDKCSIYSFNFTIVFIEIPRFHSVARYVYTSKEIMENTTSYDWGWFVNNNRRQSDNDTLYKFLG